MHYPHWLQPEIFPGFGIGSFSFRWYSLSYILAFVTTYFLAKKIHRKEPFLSDQQLGDVFFSIIIGILLGARLFYVLFYNLEYFIAHPLEIIVPFSNGQFVGIQGLSYHGGAVGALLGLTVYVKKHQLPLLKTADLWAAVVPFGYTFGRLGNFANAELYGRATTSPLGMIFPNATPFSTKLTWVREIANDLSMEITGAYINLPRHPSQLYEALFEGIILGFFLIFVIRPRFRIPGQVFSFYLIGYGFVRFFIEYLREPDEHLGYVMSWTNSGIQTTGLFVSFLNFSMGQILSVGMILIGLGLYFWSIKRSSKQ